MSMDVQGNVLVSMVFIVTILFLPHLSSVCNSLSFKRPPAKARNKSLLLNILSGNAINRTRRDTSWPGVVVSYRTPEHNLYMRILYPQNLKISTKMHKERPAYVTRGKMYCKTGYYLRINSDGSVDGTRYLSSQYVNLKFYSVGTRLLMIQGVTTSRYLTITDKGMLFGSRQRSLNSVFVETHEMNEYTTYTSYKFRHRNWLVAIKRNGKPKRAQATGIGQRSTQFLVSFSNT